MNNLAKLRGKHGYNQSEVAERLGLTKAALSYAENKKISLKIAKKSAELLGENIIDVFGADILKYVPRTVEEKEKIINIIRGL